MDVLEKGSSFVMECAEGLREPLRIGRDADRMQLRVRLRDCHSSPARNYPVPGEGRNVSMPGWEMLLVDSVGNGFVISRVGDLRILDGEELNTVALAVVSLPDSTLVAESPISPTLFANSWTALSLERDGDRWTVSAGDSGLEQLLSFDIPSFRVDSVSLLPRPGGKIESSHLLVRGDLRFPEPMEEDRMAALDVLEGRAVPAAGELPVGIWREYDRTLDESRLRVGGRYRLLVVKRGEGYVGLYLEGSKVNPGQWMPGMVKMVLTPTGVPCEFDVRWRDAEGGVLSEDVRALLDTETGLLEILFPYQNSSFRLRAENQPGPL